jgi:hypothetical protein
MPRSGYWNNIRCWVIGGKLTGGHEVKDKLEEYVRAGGHLVITAGNLENLPEGLLGVKAGQKEFPLDKKLLWHLGIIHLLKNRDLPSAKLFQQKKQRFLHLARKDRWRWNMLPATER